MTKKLKAMGQKQRAAINELMQMLKPSELEVVASYCIRAFWEMDALIRATSQTPGARAAIENRARMLLLARTSALKKLGRNPDEGGSR